MAENSELEAFLQESTSAPVSVPPEPAQPASTGESPSSSPAPAPVQDDDDGDDASPASGEEGVQAVPVGALEAERRRRQDWKERASRAETERDLLRKQLEDAAARSAAPQQPQQPAQQAATPIWRLPEVPIPNALEDPQGYAQALLYEQQRRLEVDRFNHRLDDSEERARAKFGDETVDKLIADFRTWPQSAKDEIFGQKDAYLALHRRAQALRVQQEMGDDPEAWRESERARIRAELEAEIGGTAGAGAATAPPPSRVAHLAPSLAAARSAAPRSAPAYTGAPSLEEMFPPYHARKKG